VKATKHKLVLATLLAIGCGASATAAHAMNAPEIAASVWEEGNTQCASVTLSGKDLITFRGPIGGTTAEQRAEDLADKLQDILEDQKLDPNKLVPGRDGDQITVRADGATIIKFDNADGKDPIEQGYKLVNSIRTACGVDALPNSFLKIAEINQNAAAMKSEGKCFSGPASWYGPHFHGRKCADGTRFDMNKLTAAHRFLPLGTKLLVMNRRTGASCVVKVNDRGPYVGNRVIDLSQGAARQLNMLGAGVAMVDCIILSSNQ
jgi:rare lipoprotein A